MPLKTLVKVGHISNLSDARYCAGMSVDLLGFGAVEGQPYYLAPAPFQEIRGWVTGPQVVAEVYGLRDAGRLQDIYDNYRPDLLEMGLDEWHALAGDVKLPIILHVKRGESLPAFATPPAYLVTTWDNPAAASWSAYPVLLSVNAPEELQQALTQDAAGVSLQGSDEIRPGLKDFDVLANLLEALEEES